MREAVIELVRLRKIKEVAEKEPQSVGREFELARLDMEIMRIDSELQKGFASRVLIFFDAWKKHGSFEAIRFDGARMISNPIVTDSPVQNFWNVRGEAHRLAKWADGM